MKVTKRFTGKVISHAGLISAGVGIGTYNIWNVVGGIVVFVAFSAFKSKSSTSFEATYEISNGKRNTTESLTKDRELDPYLKETMSSSLSELSKLFHKHFAGRLYAYKALPFGDEEYIREEDMTASTFIKTLRSAQDISLRPQGDAELDYRREAVLTDYFPNAVKNHLALSWSDQSKNEEEFVNQLDAIKRELKDIEDAYDEKARRESKTLGLFLQDKFPEKRVSVLELKS